MSPATRYEPVDAQQQPFLAENGSGRGEEEDERPVTEKWQPQQQTTRARWGRWLRLALEVLMVVVIVVQFVHPYIVARRATAGPVPQFPMKKYMFLENERYMHEDMFKSREDTMHKLHNWIELSSLGRGYVGIDNSTSAELGEPYMISNHGGDVPVYMMSVFHQLHCLSYLIQRFQAAYSGAGVSQEEVHHTTHCFDMLRQTVMCNADVSLEGKTEAGPGWGSVHECKDYDAVLSWANERTMVPWRGNMVDEAVL